MDRVTSSCAIIDASDVLEGYNVAVYRRHQIYVDLISTISRTSQRNLHKARQLSHR